jgi:hypothetical protein
MPKLKDTMHGYFAAAPREAGRYNTLPQHEDPVAFQYAPNTGQARTRRVAIDWNAQKTVIHSSPGKDLISVTRNGTTSIFRRGAEGKEVPTNGAYPAHARNKTLRAGWTARGHIDSRRAHVIAAQRNAELEDSLTSIEEALQTPPPHNHTGSSRTSLPHSRERAY